MCVPWNRLASAASSMAALVHLLPEGVRGPRVPAVRAAPVHAGVVLAVVVVAVRVLFEVG